MYKMWSMIAGLMLICAGPAIAGTMPTTAPSPTAEAAGPCETSGLASIAVRPGIGRAPATSGAVCVAPPGAAVLSVGYRRQSTSGVGRQYLEVGPEPVLLIGIVKRMEVIVAPGLTYSRRTGTSGSSLSPATGQQDVAFGVQYLSTDRPTLQGAAAFLITVPSGYPPPPNGFSAGVPTFNLSYTVAISLGRRVGLSTSMGVVAASGLNRVNALTHYLAYQPTLNISYALAPLTTLLLEDQISAPTGPQAPTGNRALLAIQQVVSPRLIIDAEFEENLLPAPGSAQHAYGAGVTLRL